MAEADTAAAAALAESTSESIAQDGASSMPAGVAQGGAAESEPAAPTSRLVITKMRMENFKSYYGVQEVGPFHKVRWFWHWGMVANTKSLPMISLAHTHTHAHMHTLLSLFSFLAIFAPVALET